MEQKQHVVPQVLLERFSDDGRLVLLDRDARFRVPTSVTRALKIGGYYDINEDVEVDVTELAESLLDLDSQPGLRDQILEVSGESARLRKGAIEAFFGLVEDRAAGGLRILESGSVPSEADSSDRFWLAGFIAVQYVRGEAFRAHMDDLMRASIQHFVESDPEGWVSRWNDDRRKRGLPSEAPADVIATLTESLKGMRLGGARPLGEGIRLAFEEIAPRLFTGTWRVLQYGNHDVLTSDAGVGLWARPDRDLYQEPLAIGSADTIFFPVSSRAILQILPPGSAVEEGAIMGSASKLRHSNSAVASAAHRWIVAHPACSVLGELDVSGRPIVRAEVVTRSDERGEVHELVRFFTEHVPPP